MRSTHTIGPGLLLLAGCLSTPGQAATPPPDAGPPDGPPDAPGPCAGDGGCDQLLAVAMSGWAGPAGGGWIVLRADGEGGWGEVAETSGPDWDTYGVAWGDCCGDGGPDGVPDLAGATWAGPHVSEMSVDGGALRGGIPRPVDDVVAEDPSAQVLWLDVDGDGDVDLLTGRDDLRAYVADGSDWSITPLAPGWIDHWLAAGSWDDDAEVELAAAGLDGVSVIEPGAWTTPIAIDDRAASDVAWCDVAGSPHPELFALISEGGAGVALFPNAGALDGDRWLEPPVPVQDETGRSALGGACVDLDGDGGRDFVYIAYDGIKVRPHGVAGVEVLWTVDDRIIEDLEPVIVDGVVTGLLVVMNTLPEAGYLGEVIWLPNQSAPGDFAVAEPGPPVYQAEVAGHGLAWLEVPAGVLP